MHMGKNTFTLAGYKFTLKNIQYGIHSEETVDFMANLFCDGKLLAEVSNDGHGGSTFAWITAEDHEWGARVASDISKEIWLKCQTGDIIYHDLGTVADETLMLVERNQQVAKLQKNALVLEKDSDLYLHTLQLPGMSIREWEKTDPEFLAIKIAQCMDDGWNVVNTNISKKTYTMADRWRHNSMASSALVS